MTRLTAEIIKYDPRVHVSSIGPMHNGKFGIYIGTYDESPSGSTRPRVLLTSNGEFDTALEAIEAGNKVVTEVKETEYA